MTDHIGQKSIAHGHIRSIFCGFLVNAGGKLYRLWIPVMLKGQAPRVIKLTIK